MRTTLRLAALAIVAAGFAGCASEPAAYSAMPPEPGRSVVHAAPQHSQAPLTLLQCVPYAREHSDIKISGDANTWWDRAAGKYPRGTAPETGSVMVLHNYSASDHGHVAVVKTIVSAREIRIDHANWLNDGAIYVNDPVMDVSAGNDWSAVRIYNIKSGGWGVKVYPVQGFIGSHNDGNQNGDEQQPDLVAQGGGSAVGHVAFLADEAP